MKAILSTLTFFLLSGLYCLGQDDGLDKTIQSLEAYHNRFPHEKVYLHLDKPYYSIGDDVWFKAYLTVNNSHQLSGISKILYVELIDPSDQIVQSVRLPVMGGITFGDFKLDPKYNAGSYRIRAYTNWMRNFDEGYFFDKTIRIGNGLNDDIITNSNFTILEEGNKRAVQAQITFTDFNTQPISNQTIQYAVTLDGKQLTKGKNTSDSNGSIQFNFKEPMGGTGNALMEADIPVSGNTIIKKRIPVRTFLEDYKIHFYPEGGKLIAGFANKVAFKIQESNGLSTDAKGIIQDETGAAITTLKTDFAGIGNFVMTPEAGKTYTCLLTFPSGKTEKVSLPSAATQGYGLTVNNLLKGKIITEISVSPSLIKSQQLSLLLQQNGQIFFAGKITIDKEQTVVVVPQKGLSDGISELNLLSSDGQLLAYRKVFHRNEENNLPLEVRSDQKQYAPRQKVHIDISAGNAGDSIRIGSFSVSVINLNKIPVDDVSEENIRSSLLLKSASRDYIQSPSHYFDTLDYTTNVQLDNLLLTFRRDSIWKEIGLPKAKDIQYPPEKDIRISGIVTRNNGNPVPNAHILVLATQAGVVVDTISGPDGRFAFDRLLFYDSTKFAIQARDDKGKKNLEIVLDEVPQQMISRNKNSPDISLDVNKSMETYLKNSQERFTELYRAGELEKSILLSDVKVTGKRENKAKNSANLNGPGNADQVLGEEDLQQCSDLRICLQGRLTGVMFKGGIPYSTRSPDIPMLVMVDGMDLSSDALSLIPAFDVESIEVLRSIGNLGMYGSRGAGGIILVTTKKGGGSSGRTLYSPGLVTYSPQGYYESREFPAPDYEKDPEKSIPDLRSTIFWKPNLLTDEKGETSFDFFTADQTGRYMITVEGIDLDGRIGRSVTYVDVIK